MVGPSAPLPTSLSCRLPFLTSPPCPRCHGVQRGGRHGWGEGKQQQEENEERPHHRMAHLLQHRHDRRVRAPIPPLSPINKKGGEVRRSLKNCKRVAVYRTVRALLTGAESACSAFCAWRSLGVPGCRLTPKNAGFDRMGGRLGGGLWNEWTVWSDRLALKPCPNRAGCTVPASRPAVRPTVAVISIAGALLTLELRSGTRTAQCADFPFFNKSLDGN